MITALQSQIESAALAVAELLHIGCRVISVRCSDAHERAQVHIADPGELLDHLDPKSIDGSAVRYWQLGLTYRECDVFWLLPRPAVEVALENLQRVPQ